MGLMVTTSQPVKHVRAVSSRSINSAKSGADYSRCVRVNGDDEVSSACWHSRRTGLLPGETGYTCVNFSQHASYVIFKYPEIVCLTLYDFLQRGYLQPKSQKVRRQRQGCCHDRWCHGLGFTFAHTLAQCGANNAAIDLNEQPSAEFTSLSFGG
jgi:hypothetical protein